MPYIKVKGIRVFYNDRGSGFPLIMIPTNGGASKILKSEIRYYSKHFRVLCFDLPGYGRSDRIFDFEGDLWRYSAYIIKEILLLLKIKEFNIIGTGGGAIVALHIASKEQVNCKALIADSFEGKGITTDRAKSIVFRRKNTIKLKIFQLFFKYLHGKDWQEVLTFDSNMTINFAEKKGLFFDKDFSVNCKVMLTAVSEDDMIPLVDIRVKEMIDFMPHAILHIFKKGKHPAMLSNKKEFRKLACNFLCDN